MTKKSLSLLLALIMLIVVITGCTSQTTTTTPGTTGTTTATTATTTGEEDPYAEQYTYNWMYTYARDEIPQRPSLLDELLAEKFNIVIDWEDLPTADQTETLNVLFASAEYPDVLWQFNGAVHAQRWGREGHLINFANHFDRLPNYLAMWTDEDWQTVMSFATTADGSLYYLPAKNHRVSSGAWIYRKSAFDDLGLEFPTTTDELYEVLKAIKAADPESIPIPGGGIPILNGFAQTFRTVSNVWTSPFYVDIDTNEFAYGPTTDKYRDMMIYMRKLYDENLINREFPTVTGQQWTEMYAQGKPYIQYSWATRAAWGQNTMRQFDPDVEWAWSKDLITAYPDDGHIFSSELPHFAYGAGIITRNLEGDRLNRVIDFFDWLTTDEGVIFHSFGIEGETFEYVGGEPVFMSHMLSVDNSEGTHPWQLGLRSGFLKEHPASIIQRVGPTDFEVSDAFANRAGYDYFPHIAWAFTTEEESEKADLETIINDIVDEYSLRFIMGDRDPSNDSAWDEYIAALNRANFDRLFGIYEEVYQRMQ
jgi:putative aldouronate transport system substrate-binding protein